ncbi:GGDEF domain-containing protein [Aureimonas ureilytica]|uniref:diguanylate cyclase n=1 Tax=Aureimonas ureilytica TaxID=401562 RepID=A0A175R5V0_9HYPH|nr:GGDEF domain-containing protein [Aureimonas ureilytica]KTQ90892.1 hypothetical protein NS226_15850 [Aureimonas ureilytica]
MSLDSTTLHVCNALLSATYGLMFLGAWSVQRSERHFLFWAASLLVNAICVAGFAYAPRAYPGIVSLLILGVVVAIQCLWMGMRSFDGRRPFKPPLLWLPLMSFPAHLLVIETLPANLAAAFGFLALTLMAGGASLYTLRRGEDRRSLPRRTCGLALFAYVPVYAISAIDSVAGRFDNATFLLLSDQVICSILVVSLFSVTLKRSRRALEAQALQDGLTGALNRTGLEYQLARGGRLAGRTVLAVDLDHFKLINDRFGHAAGDEVLQRFAALARRQLGPGDLLARTGGEEFVLVLAGERGGRSPDQRAEDLRRLFAETPTPWRGGLIPATVSIGLADVSPGTSFCDSMEAADRALYRVKQAGRNRVMSAHAISFPVSA